MGVLRSSSCLIRSATGPARGLRGSSDGRKMPADLGVMREGRVGRVGEGKEILRVGGDGLLSGEGDDDDDDDDMTADK